PSSGLDLKPWLQPSSDPTGLEQALTQLWRRRRDRYSEERQARASSREHAEMAYLGG
ncbi:MAG: cyclic pyranopterin phosphate synthase MoaA, partial [Cyanobacteria bacterium K_DeepCast_35m_m1_288]|nr:cyclic pyranopterin phosphate synthase MoaA [Cyanobacteria bacterium K_DeepCast_35m_m1_288]